VRGVTRVIHDPRRSDGHLTAGSGVLAIPLLDVPHRVRLRQRIAVVPGLPAIRSASPRHAAS